MRGAAGDVAAGATQADTPAGADQTIVDTDTLRVRFVKFVTNKQVVEALEFEATRYRYPCRAAIQLRISVNRKTNREHAYRRAMGGER